MGSIKLEKRPGHERVAAECEWLRLSSDAGDDYKRGKDANGFDVLPRYETESISENGRDGSYPRRVAATPVLAVVAEFVRQRRDSVMRSSIIRDQLDDEADARFAAWSSDVDRAGSDLSTFMGARLLDALTVGEAWIGIDSPPPSVIAASHYQNLETLPWATWAPRESVVDHEVDGGTVTRIAILRRGTSKGSITERSTVFETVTEWTPAEVVRYAVEGGSRLIEESRVEHGLGFVPWARFEPLRGECYAARFADLQRSILQTRSDMVAEQKANTYTLRCFWGVDPPELARAASTPGNGFAFANERGRLDTTAGDPSVMQQLRENLMLDVQEAYRRSELSSASIERGSQPESGVARAYRRSELSALLAGIAEATEAAENALLAMWCRVAGGYSDEQIDRMASTRYPRDFDHLSDRAREDALRDMYTRQGVPVEVKRAALREEIMRLWPMDTRERDALLEAVDGMEVSPARRLLDGAGALSGPPAGGAFGRPPGA